MCCCTRCSASPEGLTSAPRTHRLPESWTRRARRGTGGHVSRRRSWRSRPASMTGPASGNWKRRDRPPQSLCLRRHCRCRSEPDNALHWRNVVQQSAPARTPQSRAPCGARADVLSSTSRSDLGGLTQARNCLRIPGQFSWRGQSVPAHRRMHANDNSCTREFLPRCRLLPR